MSVKSLKVSFGAEVIVFVLILIIAGIQGFEWYTLALLAVVFLLSLWTFAILFKKMKPKKSSR